METTIATRIAVPALALAALFSCVAAPAQAQLARTFVSNAIGNDANDCSRNTPCRNFQRAHDNTLAGGEITVLDPGSYGAVTITKSISITSDGIGEAGLLVSGGANGIAILAGATDAVSLRGLTIKGIGFGGGNGILFRSGKSLTIENCAVRTLTRTANGTGGSGIYIYSETSANVTVTNTLVAQSEGVSLWLAAAGAGVTVKAILDHVAVYDGAESGIFVEQGSLGGSIQVTARDSIAAGNALSGFLVSAAAGNASLLVTRSTSANNGGAGITADEDGGIAVLRVGQSTITGNGRSWSSFGGAVQSYGDNKIVGNGDGDPAIPTLIARK